MCAVFFKGFSKYILVFSFKSREQQQQQQYVMAHLCAVFFDFSCVFLFML